MGRVGTPRALEHDGISLWHGAIRNSYVPPTLVVAIPAPPAIGDSSMKAVIASLLLASLALSNTACIGRMATSGKVMKFNLEVAETKWGRELVFLCLYIIPIYPLAGAVDLIIVNSIEFWTGTNPISGEARLALRPGEQRHVTAEDGSQAISTLREDGSIDLEIRGADGSAHFMNVVRENGHVVARDASGERIAMVDPTTGEVQPLGQADSL